MKIKKVSANKKSISPIVAVIMGSHSDYETMKEACNILEKFEIPYEKKIVSAHRSPELMFEFAKSASKRGLQVIIAEREALRIYPEWLPRLLHFQCLGFPFSQNH